MTVVWGGEEVDNWQAELDGRIPEQVQVQTLLCVIDLGVAETVCLHVCHPGNVLCMY